MHRWIRPTTKRRGMDAMDFNGWTLYAHPEFLNQLQCLLARAIEDRKRHPESWLSRNPGKRLAAVARLAFEAIPANPAAAEYRLGNTLGEHHRHWCRAKFFQQYRLFYRYDAAARLVVLAWLNDEDCLRAYGKADDAYAVFRKRLAKEQPPDAWHTLAKQARTAEPLWIALQKQLRELTGE